jgi:hypothetical protein
VVWSRAGAQAPVPGMCVGAARAWGFATANFYGGVWRGRMPSPATVGGEEGRFLCKVA